MKILVAYAQRLDALMKQKGVNVQELARASGVSRGTLNKILTNDCSGNLINARVVVKLCKALCVPLAEFFGNSLFDFENLD